MSEQLGEALLVLRTDDRGLDAGIDKAKPKAEALGRTLDETSGSATRLGGALKQAGDDAGGAAPKTEEYSRKVAAIKAAVDPAWGAVQKFKGEAKDLREALDAGAITHRQYVEEMRKSATAAGLLTNAGKQLTVMTGGQRAGVQQLTMNLGDMATMYSLNAKPSQIFASQIGQITQAIQLAAGETSKFGAFLGGPWGIALVIAAQVGGPLIAMLLDSSEASDKAAKKSETFVDSLDRQKHSLQEVVSALREYNAESKKAQESALDNAKAASVAAQAALAEAIATREQNQAALERIKTLLADPSIDPDMRAGLLGAGGSAESQLAKNEAEIARLRKDALDAQGELADQLAQVEADPVKKTREHFKELRDQARATIQDVGKLKDKLEELYKQEDQAIDRARRDARPTQTPAPSASADASLGDMKALIETLFPGATITSTTGGKHTKGSDHYAGRAIDFVPRGGMGSITTAEVEKILEDAGVTIRRNANGTKQIFGPGRSANTPGDHDDHFHVAWQGGASPEEAARRSQQAAERAARAQEKEAARVERYSRDLAGMQAAAADLQEKLTGTAEERYQLERQGLEIAAQEQARRISANRDYTNAEKLTLLGALAVKTSLEHQLLDKRHQEELARQQLEIAQATWANERDLLEKQAQLSDVRTERKAIEQKILDESYRQLEAQLRDTANNSKDEAARADARARLATLGQAKSLDQARLNREFESPIDRYMRELRGFGANIDDELGKVAVNGLERLNGSLTDVIMTTKSLGAAFHDVAGQIIADLVRIAVQKYITAPLAGLLFGGSASAGIGALGASLGTSAAASAGLGSAGASLGSSFAGMFAGGGLIPDGGWGIVGEAGPEPVFAMSGGIGVLPNSALRAGGGAGAGAGGAGRRDTLEVQISDTTGLFETRVSRIAQDNVSAGLQGYDLIVADRVQDHLERKG